MTEVHDKGVEIQGGDEVEFVVVQNQRNNKYSAVSLRKITYVYKIRLFEVLNLERLGEIYH